MDGRCEDITQQIFYAREGILLFEVGGALTGFLGEFFEF